MRSHFTVNGFKKALETAARGIKHECEWLWVDIACVPQKHSEESDQSRDIRDQEIGRQVEIFEQAEEAFAWFSSLKTTDLLEEYQFPVIIEDVMELMNTVDQKLHDAFDAMGFLNHLEHKVRALESWMSIWLRHPWFMSLWTLQEMVLRSDGWVLFDDGVLFLDEHHDDVQAHSDTTIQSLPWNFRRIKNDAWTLNIILTDWKRIVTLQDVEFIVL
ncbi:hypothetical protein NX059_002408 [Plenodomus lindquistii]|nr:hypothetical protein NX059_002408 [Plenodomus lindquistii]